MNDINPNVVLTADNSQYDRAMMASAGTTDQFAATIDGLIAKIDKVTKSAGKKLVGIAAADVAVITGATAAYAAYEKQMSQLQAQAAVMDRSSARSQVVMDGYSRSVKGLRTEFGTATSEAAQLTQQLSKVADSTTPIARLSTTFVKMSHATGESSTQLANSVTNLQRVMGTPQRETKGYADQLTTLASGANTTASALADFSSQLAPLGRMVGMSQTDITGVATAFTKAGQDGYQASTVFSKMVSDIAYATQTGSPDLAKYSNLIGVTMEQFKDMSGTEQVVKIFDQLNRLGPRAITELNQLGYDGMRTMRAITAMSNQSGGIGTSIQKARAAFDDGSVDRGSKASMKGMIDDFAKMRSEVAMTAESFGSAFAPALTKVMTLVEKTSSGFRSLMDGPLGGFVKLMAAAVAPIGAVGGGLLLMAGSLAKVAAAATFLRGAPGRGLMEGWRGGSPIVRDRNSPTGFGAMAGGTLGRTGQQIAANGSWLQRAGYNMAATSAGVLGTGFRALDSRFAGPPGAGSIGARAVAMPINAAAWATRNIGQAIYSPLTPRGMSDPTQRMRLFTSPTLGTSALGQMLMGPPGPNAPVGLAAHQAAYVAANPATVTQRARNLMPGATTTMAQQAQAMYSQQTQNRFNPNLAAGNAASAAASQNAGRLSAAFARTAGVFTTQTGPISRSLTNLAGSLGGVLGSIGAATGGAAKWGGGMLMRGLASPLGASMLPMMGVMGGMYAYDKLRDKTSAEYRDLSGSGNDYRAAGGLSSNTVWQPSLDAEPAKISMRSAQLIDNEDTLSAKRESHKLTNKGLYGMNSEEATAYLSTQWDTYKDSASSRQAVVLDLIDKFDQQTAESIIGRLDAGENFTIDSFSLDDLGGMTKKEAGDKVNYSLGMVEDMASGASITGGSEGAQATRGQLFANILSQFSAGSTGELGTVSASADDAFGVLEDKLFGGKTNFTPDDIARLTQDSYSVGGSPLLQWKQDEVGKLIAEGDMSDPRTQAKALSGMFANAMESGVEGAEEGIRSFLGNIGGDTEIDVADQKEVNKELLKVLTATGRGAADDPNSMQNRVRGLGDVGAEVINDKAAKRAATHTDNVAAQYRAIDSLYNNIRRNGKDVLDSYTELGNVQGEIGDSTNHLYQLAEATRGRVMQDVEFSRGLMTRPQVYQSQAEVLGAQLGDRSTLNRPEKEQAKEAFIQSTLEQAQFFKQALLQQRQFELSMARAQEDFSTSRQRMEDQYNLSRSRALADYNLARKHQEFDYQLMRERAEASFTRQQDRANQSYNRSMRRAHRDFSISRKRQEEDYHHSVEQMVKQSAQSLYNVYERINVKRTSSSSFLVTNIRDQVREMQAQTANLDTARGLGLSDEAIQQLGLGKSEQAQQLARLVSEMQADPTKVGEINDLINQQLSAAKGIVTDESSNDWSEWQRSYERSRDHAMEDFRKSVRDGRKDFNLQMKLMEEDFQRSMNEQAADYERSQDRQQKAFSKSMDRSAEDYDTAVNNMVDDFGKSMARAQEDLDLLNQNVAGNLKEILIASTKELSGETQKQAEAVLATFNSLDTTLGAEGISIMKRMADIFGFEYTPPEQKKGKKGSSMAAEGSAGENHPTKMNSTSRADGGVLPGRSIGRDDMHFFSREHGSLHLAGGEAVMVPEWVDKVGGPAAVKRMNNAARYGRKFSEGGVTPAAGTWSQHDGYEWARWAGDINVPGSGDLGNRVGAWKPGVVSDVDRWNHSYGWHVKVNHPESNERTLYAHLSQIAVDIGDILRAGDKIGEVGNTGKSSGPHLHFEIAGGTGPIGIESAVQNAGRGKLPDVLKDRYQKVEEAAAAVKLGNGLFEEGFWSKKMNRMARKAFRKMAGGSRPELEDGRIKWNAEGGVYDTPQIVGIGEAGPEMVLPLDSRGAGFINDIMHRSLAGTEAKQSNVMGSTPMVAHTLHSYQIDRSTTFSGPITVQANSPGEFLTQMRQRQRIMALSQASLGGARV